jgi:hypothetical protein
MDHRRAEFAGDLAGHCWLINGLRCAFACTAAAFGKRQFLITLPIGIILAFCVFGVFDVVLKLNLPGGLWETWICGS